MDIGNSGTQINVTSMHYLAHDATLEEARAAWRKAIRDCHPDRVIARGLPEEAIRMAEARVIALNHAWEEIQKEAA